MGGAREGRRTLGFPALVIPLDLLRIPLFDAFERLQVVLQAVEETHCAG